MKKAKIIAVANQKGGVAKTTSVRNMAFSLEELRKRVLAVDFDPQSNLTASFSEAEKEYLVFRLWQIELLKLQLN